MLPVAVKERATEPPFPNSLVPQVNSAFGGDVLVDDALDSAVLGELLKSVVDGVEQSGVALGNADGVVLLNPGGVEDAQALIGFYQALGRGVVDDDAVNLSVQQGLNGYDGVVVGGYGVLAELIDAELPAGSTAIYLCSNAYGKPPLS